ncbi:TniB family NTP-binding protein [uncultured Parvibaculum sp.]|uniref:TniB family NTP-binding protein n=1 Tax=uncultured Parvibaculum sp. TaxID=291828 RepID=UPI0030D7A553
MTNDSVQIEQLTRKRAQAIREAVMLFPKVDHALKEINMLHKRGVVGERADCLVLYGESGAGKTQALQLYRQNFAPHIAQMAGNGDPAHRGSFLKSEVVFVETPSPASRRALIDRIQASLEPEPLSVKMTLGQRRERLIKMLEKAGVELLIIDEFQHLFDRKSQQIVQDAADLIKSLLNAAVCPIVLAGTPDILKVLQEATQLKNRMYSSPKLSTFNWDDPNEQHLFCSYLAEVEKKLAFDEDSNLADLDCAKRIHYASRGLIGEVARLLVKASDVATRAGLPRITNECLAAAIDYAWILDNSMPVNPFRQKTLPTRQIDYAA